MSSPVGVPLILVESGDVPAPPKPVVPTGSYTQEEDCDISDFPGPEVNEFAGGAATSLIAHADNKRRSKDSNASWSSHHSKMVKDGTLTSSKSQGSRGIMGKMSMKMSKGLLPSTSFGQAIRNSFMGDKLAKASASMTNARQSIKMAKAKEVAEQPAAKSFIPQIEKPTSVKGCGYDLNNKGMVVLPMRVPPNVLQKARLKASEALENTVGSVDSYYDVSLRDERFREQSLLDLWEPVIQASSMDRFAGNWSLLTNGFLACMPGAKQSPWPKPPPPVSAAEAVGAMLLGFRGSSSGRSSMPCMHVIVPLLNLTPNPNGQGLAKLDLKAGDILIVDCNVTHQGFGTSSRGPHPMLYWTYLRRALKPLEEEQVKQEEQVQNFSSWARKKGFRLPQVAVCLIKRQDLRKHAWDEQSPQDKSRLRYEATIADVDDENAEENQSDEQFPRTPHFGGLEDEKSKPSDSSNPTASFSDINSMFKAIHTTITSDRHTPKEPNGKGIVLSNIYADGPSS